MGQNRRATHLKSAHRALKDKKAFFAETNFKDRVLEVALPKVESAEHKTIKVE